jgi:hypothetical protein
MRIFNRGFKSLEFPHCVRDDFSSNGYMVGCNSGYAAATAHSYRLRASVILIGAKRSEESIICNLYNTYYKMLKYFKALTMPSSSTESVT